MGKLELGMELRENLNQEKAAGSRYSSFKVNLQERKKLTAKIENLLVQMAVREKIVLLKVKNYL